jgi:hypothetical protein
VGYYNVVTILLYSGSKHGWKSRDFHSRCDNKGPTITLFKVEDGDCIGGFTKASWSSDNKDVVDTAAMLFNLNRERWFPHGKSNTNNYSINCYANSGPCFGGFGGRGYLELGAYSSDTSDRKCVSWAG